MRLNMEDYIILSGMTNACLEVGIFHLNLKKVLFRNTLEHLLDRRRVADEAHGHLQSLRRDVTDPALHVVPRVFLLASGCNRSYTIPKRKTTIAYH